MKTREEKIAELSEVERLVLEYYEYHKKKQLFGCKILQDYDRNIYDYGQKIAGSLNLER